MALWIEKPHGGEKVTNKRALKAALAMEGMNQTGLAKAVGMSPATLSNRIVGRTEFSASEIQQIRETLHLSDGQMIAIFFAGDVD